MLSVLGGELAPVPFVVDMASNGYVLLVRGGGHHALGTRMLQPADCHTDLPSVRPKKALRQSLARAISWRMAVCMEVGIGASAYIQ